MPAPSLVLASGSATRAELLRRARVDFVLDVPNLDEAAIRASLLGEGAGPRDIADVLAEMKAVKVSARHPGQLVLGADQVLGAEAEILGKPGTPEEACAQIARLLGRTHRLFTAAVIARDGTPEWRHVSTVRLTMGDRSSEWVARYVERNWDSIRHSVGGYRLEEEGIRLFSRIEGDYFAILGLPLVELLTYLTLRGVLR